MTGDVGDPPRIFVEILKPVGNGQHISCRFEISLDSWMRGLGTADAAIRTGLAEISQHMRGLDVQ